jgi:F-type H+-transporting ATPase subunit delta
VRDPTIARNYAQALLEAGERRGEAEQYAGLIEAVAGALEADPRIRVALESPRVTKEAKQRVLQRALGGRAPEPFIRFLGAVVKRGRQGLLPAISREYHLLLDHKLNRLHAGVVLAREPDERLLEEIRRRLSAAIGKEIVPHVRADPRILGGIIVRVGDRVMDGSLRRKLMLLRRHMLGA